MSPFPLLRRETERERQKYLTNPTIIVSHPLSYPTPLNVRVKLLHRNLFCANDSIYCNKQLQLAECKGGSEWRKSEGEEVRKEGRSTT